MAKVKISDIIQPPVWLPYVTQKSTALNRLIQSGVVVTDPTLSDRMKGGGAPFINVPYFNPLTGSSQVLSDSADLSVGGLTTAKTIAYCLGRGDARSVNDLATIRSGADPAKAIGDGWAEWWSADEQTIMLAVLKGVFADNAANDDSDLINDIAIEDGTNATAANKMSGAAIINAAQKMGDAKGKLAVIVMHSQVEANLKLLDEISVVRDSEGTLLYNSYKGLEVLVDDTCPVVAGSTSGYKYTSYLAARGSVGRGLWVPTDEGVEWDRDILAGDTVMTMRRHLLLHPYGYSAEYAAGDLAGDSPANTELDDAAAWTRKYEKKNTGLVSIVTNG